MIKELIDKITSETVIDDIMPDLVEIGNKEDELEARITELEGDVLARDEEIKSLKETNFEAADTNLDSKVDILDLLRVRKYILKSIKHIRKTNKKMM